MWGLTWVASNMNTFHHLLGISERKCLDKNEHHCFIFYTCYMRKFLFNAVIVENDKKLLIRLDTELVNESSPIKLGIFSKVCNKLLISRYQCQVHSWTISFGLSMEWIGLQWSQQKVGKVAINYMEGTQASCWIEIGAMIQCQETVWEFLWIFGILC